MKYLVKVGSLSFEQGSFSRGDVIELTVERAAKLDPNDIQLIPEDIEAKTVMKLSTKRFVKKTVANQNEASTSPIPEKLDESPAA